MEQLNIKDYLQLNTNVQNKQKQPVEYSFTKIFDNGSDFIIERVTNNKIKRQLCFIANDNLLFIRDPKTNKDVTITSERQIKDFFINTDNYKQIEKFKNDFFQSNSLSDFSYNLYKLHKEKVAIRRELVKYGINPQNYINTARYGNERILEALDNENFDKILKIIKICQEFETKLRKKDKDYKQQVDNEFIMFLYRLQNKYSVDYVRIFLEIYTNSDSHFYPSMNNYYYGNTQEEYKCLSFENPIDDFNLDFKRFLTYIFRDLYAQGIDEIDASILSTYNDCLNIQKQIYGKVKEKYPEHLKECHDKVTLIYNLNLQYFKEQKVKKLKVHNKELEISGKTYSIIAAKTSEDLISEGINLHHCVGSYVDKVNDGDCSIFFLRKTDELDTSLITIEVVDDKVLQVRGLCERRMDNKERNFLNRWVKEKNLQFISE